MKIKEGFILRKVAKQYVVVATGKASKDFNGMIRLNASAAYLFGLMKENMTEESLVEALMAEYAVEEAIAKEDVSMFLSKLKEAGAIV